MKITRKNLENLIEAHGLSAADSKKLKDYMGKVDDKEVKRILRFLIKSNVEVDKTQDVTKMKKESKMKITKANIKKLVAESIGDIFSENATISENADNDRVIEEIATAALGAIMNFGDFELERLIPDAGDRAEFTNKFKSGVIKDLKQFSELPPRDQRLPPLERLNEGNEEMADVAQTLHRAAKLIADSELLKTLRTKGMQDGDLKAYDEAFEIFTKLMSLRDKVSK